MKFHHEADAHFRDAETHVKAGNHKEAWKHLSAAQISASKHAHELASQGDLNQAKIYRKITLGRTADLARKLKMVEDKVGKTLQEAKKLIKAGQIKEALKLLKSVSEDIKGGIAKCPQCGADAAVMKDDVRELGECPKCGMIWDKKSTYTHLIKYTETSKGDNTMVDPEKKDALRKEEVVEMLWDLWRKGDPEVDALDINNFSATGWLKKSLAVKLGLPIPGEATTEELTKKNCANPPKDLAKKSEDINAEEFLSKGDVLDVLLQLLRDKAEPQRVNRHVIAKFEATGELDDDLMQLVYKKAGKDWSDLRKRMCPVKKEACDMTKEKTCKCKMAKEGKACKCMKSEADEHDRELQKAYGIDTAWQGGKATHVSEEGEHGEVPYSELAMHTRHAGQKIKQYSLFGDKGRTTWAHVKTDKGILDGLPGEVLPFEIQNRHGINKSDESVEKAKGDSDFLDDKKKHGSQRRGPLKPVVIEKEQK